MDVTSSHSAGSSEPSPAQHNCAGIYSPLDKSKTEIRLLTLSTRRTGPNDTAQLHALIETFSFDFGSIPTYEALSYEWHPPSSSRRKDNLVINGKEKQMPTNLFGALLCLGKRTRLTSWLWVDALCINQEDAPERSHQVQFMWRIYNEAHKVYVWLGSTWTVGVKKRAANLLREFQTRVIREEDALGTFGRLLLHDENYKNHLEAINSVLSQSYWTRSWIVQELIVAKRIYLLALGDLEMPHPISLETMMTSVTVFPEVLSYEGFTDWATICPIGKADEKAVRRRMETHHAIAGISSTKYKDDPEMSHNDLLSLLARFYGQLATDPRDKVYSLLGMVEPNSDNSLRADYTLTWTEVLRDAAIYVIRDRNDLEVLVYAGSSVTELPSWVPNWLDQERQGATRFPHDRYCLSGRCCSPHTAQAPLHTDRAGHRLPKISADGSLLTISASLFNIQSCSKIDSPDIDMEAWRTWAPLGELGDIMFSTWRANLAILDDSDPELPAKVVFEIFQHLWWHTIFYFHPGGWEILSQKDFIQYIVSFGQETLTERQRQLLRRTLDEQFPFLTEVTPSVGSAIFTSDIFAIEGAKSFAKRILDRQATVYIPGMCFWSSECGTLGPHHVLASIPLCRFPIILSKPEGSGTGYKVTTSARVANLEHGQIEQDD